MFNKKKQYFLLIILTGFILSGLSGNKYSRKQYIMDALRAYMSHCSGDMLQELKTLQEDFATPEWDSVRSENFKKQFLKCRLAYKKIEAFSCYYFLASGDNLNGPVVTEIEDESEAHPQPEPPHGLQVIESALWSENPSQYRNELMFEADLLHHNVSTLQGAFTSIYTDEARFFESIQLEVIRVFTLGIADFDTPECRNGMEESRTVLNGLIEILSSAYSNEKSNAYLENVLNKLRTTLIFFNRTTSFQSMDFLSCLRDHYVPLSRALAEMRSHVVEENYYPNSALRLDRPSIYQQDAFNTFFYNPRGTDMKLSGKAEMLGRTLFFDPVFSENNKRACASCHQPEHAFTDKFPTSIGFHANEKLTRNAPTLINVALQRSYFYDMRADNLEGQIGHVIANTREMKSSFDEVVCKLESSSEYKALFREAFTGTEDTVISRQSIEKAIAEYERTLVSMNSKFDRNVRGDENSFTPDDKKGFNIFMEKGRCGTCHYLPFFNNVVPPEYTRSEWEIIGTTTSEDTVQPSLDPDPGRGGVYGTAIFMHAFKTSGLRNVALTAPYMHNGNFKTLESVIRFYNHGGGAGLGLQVPNQTLSPDPLNLSSVEIKSLVAFLNTLTDTVNLTAKPARLPFFPDSLDFNQRKIGGEY